ncbi:hypothetical protein REPUB_Repub10bG0084600 [Reevesia pubescens]
MEHHSNKVFTVFVNNLPQEANHRWVTTIFQKFGRVVDVFLPVKRSKWGRRIGFVRYSSVFDARSAIWNLNGVFFLDNKIGVNMARFNPRNAFWKKVERIDGTEKESGKTLQNGESSKWLNQQSDIQKKSYVQALLEERNNKAFTNHCTSDGVSEKRNSCIGVIDEEKVQWLQRTLIGRCKGSSNEEVLLDVMENSGIKDVTIRRFSGRDFLITVEDMETFNRDKQKGWDRFCNWFDNITQWSDESKVDHRYTWLVCYGVPIHAWNLETFQNIGSLWGEFIKMDDTSLNSSSFARGCFQITTRLFDRIDESIFVKIGPMEYSVKVRELNHECDFTGYCCYENTNRVLRGVQESEGSSVQFVKESLSPSKDDNEVVLESPIIDQRSEFVDNNKLQLELAEGGNNGDPDKFHSHEVEEEDEDLEGRNFSWDGSEELQKAFITADGEVCQGEERSIVATAHKGNALVIEECSIRNEEVDSLNLPDRNTRSNNCLTGLSFLDKEDQSTPLDCLVAGKRDEISSLQIHNLVEEAFICAAEEALEDIAKEVAKVDFEPLEEGPWVVVKSKKTAKREGRKNGLNESTNSQHRSLEAKNMGDSSTSSSFSFYEDFLEDNEDTLFLRNSKKDKKSVFCNRKRGSQSSKDNDEMVLRKLRGRVRVVKRIAV